MSVAYPSISTDTLSHSFLSVSGTVISGSNFCMLPVVEFVPVVTVVSVVAAGVVVKG